MNSKELQIKMGNVLRLVWSKQFTQFLFCSWSGARGTTADHGEESADQVRGGPRQEIQREALCQAKLGHHPIKIRKGDLNSFAVVAIGSTPHLHQSFSQCWGSVTFWCGSGPVDPYLLLMDPDPTPDPTPFFSDFKDAKKYFFSYFLLELARKHITFRL
jgi:hypothetical protein